MGSTLSSRKKLLSLVEIFTSGFLVYFLFELTSILVNTPSRIEELYPKLHVIMNHVILKLPYLKQEL